MMTLDFTGKNAIVVGAASGIGRGIATVFADNNANVWIGDLSEENAAKVVEELSVCGNSYGFTRVDVSDKESLRGLFKDAKEAFGRIDIVVNSAGVFIFDHFLEGTPESINKHLNINLMGVLYGCQLALEYMMEQGGGKVVNVASGGGRRGEFAFPFYALGKAGVLNLTQSAAYNGAPYNINVNAVCPGTLRTPMWDAILQNIGPDRDPDELFDEFVKERSPLGRAQTPEEIAYGAAFFCSKYADNITGQALNIDGGWIMS
jgi:NAD(P)-dependent dehydrogenase (short-subunit alcohol dehydrogenase family)